MNSFFSQFEALKQMVKSAPEPEAQLPEGEHEVRLSVYRLPYIGRVGGYHSGVVVRRGGSGPRECHEYAFGAGEYHDCGVYRSEAEKDANPDYQFYQRHVIGRTRMPWDKVMAAVEEVAKLYYADEYTLTGRNCNHFSSDVCWRLLKVRPPEWVNSLADGLEASARRNNARNSTMRAEEAAFIQAIEDAAAEERKSLAEVPPELTSNPPDRGDAACLVLLYLDREEFTRVFGRVWDATWGQYRSSYRNAMAEGAAAAAAKNEPWDRVQARLDWETPGYNAASARASQAARRATAAAARAAVARARDLEEARAIGGDEFDEATFVREWEEAYSQEARRVLKDGGGGQWLKMAVGGAACSALRRGAAAIGLDEEVFEQIVIDEEYLVGQWDETWGTTGWTDDKSQKADPVAELQRWLRRQPWEENAWKLGRTAGRDSERRRMERLAAARAAAERERVAELQRQQRLAERAKEREAYKRRLAERAAAAGQAKGVVDAGARRAESSAFGGRTEGSGEGDDEEQWVVIS
eukprot:CAMPEP_0114547118 /NCGR_PEP_ID=MMETSP0114-20121206/4297_1 /TAXON_ID=31324 /ORGANISM="Goniomonas sp, Strain m" /LENGTH=523 /DNA_ID=CAMNT_0001731659 /DNA_START=66 /DNA_END=1633 /DNA_ORIENTATION=-